MTIKAVFGIHAGEKIDITIDGGAAGAEESRLTIRRRDGGVESVAGSRSWSVSVGPGDHFLQVAGDVEGPFTVSTSKPTVIATIDPDRSPPHVVAFRANTTRIAEDPKNPWPDLAAATPRAELPADARIWLEGLLRPLAEEAASRGPG
jgi:hypothetical protein